MTTTPLAHFDGIPDEFIRALNQRFRELEAIRQPKPAETLRDVVQGAGNLETEGALVKVSEFPGKLEESSLLETDVVRGAAALTASGRIPKNTATDGQLTQSALTDSGTRITSTEPLEIDIGASPAEIPLGIKAAGGGFLGFRVNGPDSLAVHFDYERTGGVNIARDNSIAALVKGGDFLLLYYNSGETPGAPITALNLSAAINLANGRWGFGGNAAPGYEVDVNGVVNASTAYRVGGNLGVTGTIVLAKITPGGGNGSISFVGGIPVGVVSPT